MKKTNYNIIVFVAAAILIGGAWCSVEIPSGIKNAIVDFIKNPNLNTFIEDIDTASNNISYKGLLVDTYSLTYRLTGTRVVEKPDSTVVRMNNDYLSFKPTMRSDEDLISYADQCAVLKEATDNLGIPFVYALTPTKEQYGVYPDGVLNCEPINMKKWVSLLTEREIDVFHIGTEMQNQNIPLEQAFFVTDHHWKPETAFWACGELCKYLERSTNFSYDESVFEIQNYEIETYQDCFLGSQGKKTGQYFTPLGLDDFSVFTPKYETNLTVTDDRGVASGNMNHTLITPPNDIGKNLHFNNIYTTYSGSDYGLQVVENHLAESTAPKILVIRDSFGCPFTPFLAPVSSSLHLIDARNWTRSESIIEYITAEKPDYVVILYSEITGDKFTFS